MKIKIFITLSEELLREIDARLKAQPRTRSDFIEAAVRAFFAKADRIARQTREAALLQKHAPALNAEMADVLQYQVSREARRPVPCLPPLPNRS
jgi:metal-responsive CopG/Arc/MetJ family transcriptional regulator